MVTLNDLVWVDEDIEEDEVVLEPTIELCSMTICCASSNCGSLCGLSPCSICT